MKYADVILKNIFLLVIVSIAVFFLFSALPTDPVRVILGLNASEDAVSSLRHELGLDKTLFEQFISYIKNILSLDLGKSFVTRQAVAPDILDSFLSTQLYSCIALIISVFYSVVSVFVVFFTKKYVKKIIQTINSFFVSIPGLIIAVLFGIVLSKLNILGFIENITTRNVINASFVLSVYPSCILSQLLINEFQTVKKKQFVIASKSFGFDKRNMFAIIFRNAFLPWLSQLSNIAASLISGSIVIEYVFSLPGIGNLIYQSILRHDYPMVQGVVLITSFTYIIFNLSIETLYNYLIKGRKVK